MLMSERASSEMVADISSAVAAARIHLEAAVRMCDLQAAQSVGPASPAVAGQRAKASLALVAAHEAVGEIEMRSRWPYLPAGLFAY